MIFFSLILPLLLYAVYLIREFQKHLDQKNRLKKWTLFRKLKDDLFRRKAVDFEEAVKFPTRVASPCDDRRSSGTLP